MDPKQTSDSPPAFAREITLPAALDNLDRLLEWIETVLADYSCPARTSRQIAMATEEIFVNIANYAYPGKTGDATLRTGRAGKSIVVQFEDGGIPFDPLAWPNPQTKASIEERTIGGLGIFLVKKTMDRVSYARVEGKNQLTFYKIPEGTGGSFKSSAQEES
jgi:anti-sigma regulatory factor (Ser/Thr protein kinase)